MTKRIPKIFIIMFFLYDIIFSQPYFFYSVQDPDTSEGKLFYISRLNVANNETEAFPPNQLLAKYVRPVWDPSQSFLAVEIFNYGYRIYDCLNPSIYYENDDLFGINLNEILYLPDNNKLYLFANEYQKILTFNLTTSMIDKEINFTNIIYSSSFIYPRQAAFFSEDSSKIYFLCKENLNSPEQVWTFSIDRDSIIQKKSLSEYNYSNEDGYNLQYGINGRGLIEGYITDLQSQDYSILDLNKGTKTDLINFIGWAQSLFIDIGNYIIVLPEIDIDDLTYLTGTFKFYNYINTKLIKTINLPFGGKILNSNAYPNNIYYVIDIEKPTRQIYTLKMDSIFNVLDLTSLNPSSAIVNSSSFTLTVNGHGFDTLSTVYFNDTAKTTTFVSDSVLTAEISATDISIVGSYPVWATDEWGTSDTLMFTVVPQTPYLSKISPSLALPYDVFAKKSSFNVMVIGNNFTTSSVAYFNGVAKTTTYISDSLITFQLSSGDVGTTEKTVSVWIQNSNQFSDTLLFNVLATLPNQITPILECVRENGANSYTAYFGYNNYNSEDVLIPFGTKNNISSQFSSITGSPVNIFLSGRQTNVFSIDFNGREIFWHLNGKSVSASSKSPPCP